MSWRDATRGGTSAGLGGRAGGIGAAGGGAGLGFGGFSVRGRLAGPPSMLMRGNARSFFTFSFGSLGLGSLGLRGSVAMLFSRPRTVPADP